EFSQASESKSEEKIDIEPELPHNGMKITKLKLSPDNKYVATWKLQDNQLVKQSTEQSVKQSKNELNQFKLFGSIDIEEFCVQYCHELSAVSKLCAISNNKFVAISDTIAATIHRKRIEVIELEKKKKIELNLYQYRDCSMEECRFYADEDNNESIYIVAHDYECRYIFKFLCNKESQSWKIDASIYCDREKIMLIDKCRSLTQWNLKTLLFEKQYQLGWKPPHSEYESKFYGVLLRSLEFISSDIQERLLLFFDNENFEIRDPYDLEQVIPKRTMSKLGEKLSISNLCEKLFNEKPSKKEEFITMINEKIYYTFDKNLWVQKVTKEQWIKYLREILGDYNKTKVLPSKPRLEKILKKFIQEGFTKEDNVLSCKGSLVKWEVNNDEKTINAFLKTNLNMDDWNEIWGGIRIDIYECDLLDNEDLAMITSAGLFIWSIWPKYEEKRIRLRYYLSYQHEHMEEFDFNHLLEMIQKHEKKNLLPAPDFEFFIDNYKERLTEDFRLLFEELLDDYIEDKILMKSYGRDLLMCSLRSKKYSLVGKLCRKIYKETENNNMLEKFQLLDIFTLLFTELTYFPQLLKEFLSYTLFIHSIDYPEEIQFCKFFSEPHLQSHINYLQPYFTNNVMENIGCLDRFYEIACKVNNNNWDGNVEILFIPNSLLNIVNLHKKEDKTEDKDELFQKLESIKTELIRKFSEEISTIR
ncbi:13707_t:CDS:2, partial [Gigaspora margarita]